jgi:hypothetical protein
MKIKLTVSERLRLITMLNEFKGNLDTLVAILDDVKKIKIEEKEWEKAERVVEVVKNEKGEDISQWRWNDEKAGDKEVELDKDTVKFLKSDIEKKDKNGEITLQDVVLIELNKKLK